MEKVISQENLENLFKNTEYRSKSAGFEKVVAFLNAEKVSGKKFTILKTGSTLRGKLADYFKAEKAELFRKISVDEKGYWLTAVKL